MKVLIGIVSKNRKSILPKAIDSALSQTYKNKEVWVFDDNSSDGTVELQWKYPMVKWIFSSESLGYVYARNLFMKQPGFDFFCSLDDDSWFIEVDALEMGIEYMINNTNVGALGYDMLTPENPESKSTKLIFRETNSFIGCGHIINLIAAKQVGYYILNPGFYGGEEKDLSIRMYNVGFKIVEYVNKYVWHDKTAIARNLPLQHRSGVCNDMVFTWRRTPFIYLIPSLIIKTYKHLRFSITFKKQSLFKPFILGMIDFYKWLIIKKTNRNPVRVEGFKKYLNANKV